MSLMTAFPPPELDERPTGRINDRASVRLLVAAIWVGFGGLLWLLLRSAEGNMKAAILAGAITGSAAATAHAVIAAQGWHSAGPWRWPAMAVVLALCTGVAHALLSQLGMVQSFTQDLLNLTMVSGIALAIREAWVGRRARLQLADEARRRAEAEARFAEGRLRPAGLLAVKVGHTERMIDPAEVSHVEAEGNFAVLNFRDGRLFVSEPLKDLVERLSPYGFVRVHRSHAVNADWIEARRRDAVVLRGGATLTVGRAYRS
jgi:DNA-binding LytR/AlgR family response regulator